MATLDSTAPRHLQFAHTVTRLQNLSTELAAEASQAAALCPLSEFDQRKNLREVCGLIAKASDAVEVAASSIPDADKPTDPPGPELLMARLEPAKFTASVLSPVYLHHPSASGMAIGDQLNCRLGQLVALLTAACGGEDSNLNGLSAALRDDYIWLCAQVAGECQELAERMPVAHSTSAL